MAADTVVKEAQRAFFRARCRRPRSSLSLSLLSFRFSSLLHGRDDRTDESTASSTSSAKVMLSVPLPVVSNRLHWHSPSLHMHTLVRWPGWAAGGDWRRTTSSIEAGALKIAASASVKLTFAGCAKNVRLTFIFWFSALARLGGTD